MVNEKAEKELIEQVEPPVCPLLKVTCLKDRCAWYICFLSVNECAMYVLGANSEYQVYREER